LTGEDWLHKSVEALVIGAQAIGGSSKEICQKQLKINQNLFTMNLEIKQEGYGEIEFSDSIPDAVTKSVLNCGRVVVLSGHQCIGLFQQFQGDGFSAWYNKFLISAPTILNARGDVRVLELRIALRNIIKGKWDQINQAELPVNHFQMGFVPHIITKAIFEAPQLYETFDIHFEFSFLEKIGIDYKTLDRFMKLVYDNQPAELSKRPFKCTNFMLDSIYVLLQNSYTAAGKARLLHNNVTNILIAALEEVGKEEIDNLPLSIQDIDALHHVKELIETHCPVYPGNDVLIKKARNTLNAFKLSYGFKRLFGVSPYEYFQEQRFLMAKGLLREGNKVNSVAHELEYESSTAFIKAFRQRFHRTPKQFQKSGG